jgi:replicative DNA helicase
VLNPAQGDSANWYIETEQEVLGALMQSNDVPPALAGLKPEHFIEPTHQTIFRAIQQGADEARSAALFIAVRFVPEDARAAFEARSDGTKLSAYMARMVGASLGGPGLPRTIQMMQAQTARHNLGRQATALAAAANDMSADPRELVAKAREAFDEIAASARDEEGPKTLDTAICEAQDGAERRKGVTTGLLALDNKLAGYVPGQLYVIAGRPGMGKSAFMCSSLRRTAERNQGVAVFSLEMTAAEVGARCASDALDTVSGPTFGEILRGLVKADEITVARDSLAGLPMLIEDGARLTFNEIAQRAREAKSRFQAQGIPLAVVCIDHMGLVTPSDRYAGNKVAEAGEISGAARALAKELDCCVLLLCQLNRAVEGREDKRPTLADLRWSGEIEQDAHVVAFLYRPAYYLSQDANVDPHRVSEARNKLEFLIRKNRNGETADLSLWCSIGHSMVRDE